MYRSSVLSPTVGRALVAAMSLLLVGTTMISPSPVRAVTGPVAQWTLDDGSGGNANDSIGTADGTLVGGPTWLTSDAAVGTGAVRFGGVDERIEVTSAPALEPNLMTLTAWVRAPANNAPTPGQVIVEKGAFGCDGASYGLYVAANGIRFSVRAYDGTYLTTVLTESAARTTLWDNTWHLISAKIGWVSGGTGGLVHGFLMIDASPTDEPMFADQGPGLQDGGIKYSGVTDSGLRIGGPVDASCATDYFEGDIDDVRLYADDNTWVGGLMPPIATTTTVEGPAVGHPGEWLTYTAHVSPAPRWGQLIFELYYDGAWRLWGSFVPLDANGDATFERLMPTDLATYPMHVLYAPAAQYVASEDGFDVVVSGYPTTTTLAITPSPSTPFQDETLTATVTSGTMPSNLFPLGSVEFYDTTTVTPVLLGTQTLGAFATGVSKAVLHVNTFGAGTHKILAKYVGPDPIRALSQSTDSTLQINAAGTSVQLSLDSAPPIETHHSFAISASISAPNDAWAASATLTFRRVGVSTPICIVAVNPNGPTTCTVPAQSAGALQLTATYSGNSQNQGATSPPLPVTVVADTVHATGVSTQYTTFYPVKDVYKDTVAMKGVRNEPIGVTIKIYKPSGSLLKTVTIASVTGAYSYAWNGRTSGGTLYASGKYKVVQTLKDSAGTTKTYTTYVTLSKKRLHTYTKTITKYGSSTSAKGVLGTGSLSYHTSSGYVIVKAGSLGWAGLGWEFTLPSATIYKSIKFQTYSKSGLTGAPVAIGMQNFAACPYASGVDWDLGCFDKARQVGNSSNTVAWYTSTGSVTTNRSGKHARGTLSVNAGTVTVYKARIVVTYGVLK